MFFIESFQITEERTSITTVIETVVQKYDIDMHLVEYVGDVVSRHE